MAYAATNLASLSGGAASLGSLRGSAEGIARIYDATDTFFLHIGTKADVVSEIRKLVMKTVSTGFQQ